jgi:hypothetical protein
MKLELTKEKLDKLYEDTPNNPETETEFQRVYRMGRNALVLELIEKLTPIEIPSDEEIYEQAKGHSTFAPSFIYGAEWMRDKIQGGNK